VSDYAAITSAMFKMRGTLPPIITGMALLDYVKEHAEPMAIKHQDSLVRSSMLQGHVNGFWRVTRDLPAFKKVYGPMSQNAIANLVIPAGAKFYASSSVWNTGSTRGQRKMRASRAMTHSIALIHNGDSLNDARAAFVKDYVYTAGLVARPKPYFSGAFDQCDPGIHIFLNVTDAFDY
jgi:hypothetical protein